MTARRPPRTRTRPTTTPTTGGSSNPATNRAADRAFQRALHGQVDALAVAVTLAPADAAVVDRRDERDKEAIRRRVAAAWVYLSCIAAWAEDHHLVEPLLRRSTGTHPAGPARTPASGAVWLGRAFGQLAVHPATQWLMHPAYQPMLWAGTPSPSACHALIDWWASDAPTLAYQAAAAEPVSITGWPIGDLLPVLYPDKRTGNALVQTPYFVADLLLDETLLPAADTFRDEPLLRVVDPACGTGHVLIRAVDYLWQWYTTGRLTARAVAGRTPVTGGTVYPPAEAARRILAGVDGVELDPLTAAVARLRLTVYIAHLMAQAGVIAAPLRLADIPPTVTPRIAVGDALLLGKVSRTEYTRLHPHLADLPGAAFPLDDFRWPDGPVCVLLPPGTGR